VWSMFKTRVSCGAVTCVRAQIIISFVKREIVHTYIYIYRVKIKIESLGDGQYTDDIYTSANQLTKPRGVF